MVEEIQCTLHCPQTAEGWWPSKNPQSCVSQEQSILLYIYIYISQLAPCTSPNEMAHVVQKIASLTGSIHSGLDEQLVLLTAVEVTSLSLSARSSKIRLLKAVSGPERFFFIKVLCQHPLQDSCQLFNIDIILQLRFGLKYLN